MSKSILHRVLRLFTASAVVVTFAVASGPIVPATSLLSTEALAVNGIRTVTNLCFWEDLTWDEMQPSEQKAWRKLGWTRQMWDSTADNAYPLSEEKDWIELTDFERRALLDLGYTAKTWETFDADAC